MAIQERPDGDSGEDRARLLATALANQFGGAGVRACMTKIPARHSIPRASQRPGFSGAHISFRKVFLIWKRVDVTRIAPFRYSSCHTCLTSQ